MKHQLRCSGIAVLVTLLAPAAAHAQRWVDANFRPTSGLGGGETETFRGLEDQYLDRHVVTAIGMAEARDKPNMIVLRVEPMGCPEARDLPTSCGDDTWTVTLRASRHDRTHPRSHSEGANRATNSSEGMARFDVFQRHVSTANTVSFRRYL